jgi:hypothetical protein
MDWEAVIIGGIAILWGIILLAMRHEILEFSREGGRGLRNRKVINLVVVAASVFLLAGGIAIITIRGL